MTTASVMRRLRLPAAQSSPAAARTAVYEAIIEVDLVGMLDEALLLTTELVTNAVIHARTDLEIEIAAGRDGISVMVLDHHCGPLALTEWDGKALLGKSGGSGELRERGRGLFLVDRLASRWGTLHHAGGKGVWFRLDYPAGQTVQPQPGLAEAPGSGGEDLGQADQPPDPVDGLAAELTERKAWLTFLAEAGELLAQSLDVELTIALIPRLVVPRLGLWCAVHTSMETGQLCRITATHADEDLLTDLTERLDSAIGMIAEARQSEGAVVMGPPLDGYAVRLIARGQLLGVLTVGRKTSTWFNPDEIAVIEDMARRAALAIDNACIHADLRSIATELQRSLLPPELPKARGIEFGAEYVPTGAGVDVGGDFYDVIQQSDDRWLVTIGDVSGKGIQVATVTGLVRDVTRALVRDGRSLPDVLSVLNGTLVERGGERFCTVAFAQVEPRPHGILAVRLYLAGHDQPIHVRGSDAATFVGRCGTALGLLDQVRSPEFTVELRPGETLVFYTDGVTERRRGADLFGQERLRQEAAALSGYPADVVAARLRATTLAYSPEPPVDDIAIFVMRNDGSLTS